MKCINNKYWHLPTIKAHKTEKWEQGGSWGSLDQQHLLLPPHLLQHTISLLLVAHRRSALLELEGFVYSSFLIV